PSPAVVRPVPLSVSPPAGTDSGGRSLQSSRQAPPQVFDGLREPITKGGFRLPIKFCPRAADIRQAVPMVLNLVWNKLEGTVAPANFEYLRRQIADGQLVR